MDSKTPKPQKATPSTKQLFFQFLLSSTQPPVIFLFFFGIMACFYSYINTYTELFVEQKHVCAVVCVCVCEMRYLSGVVKEAFGCEGDGDDYCTHGGDHPRRSELQRLTFPFPTPTHFP